MGREDAFQVEGHVVEVLSEKTYRVELANGHRLLAFVAGRVRPEQPRWLPGSKVRLQLSPYDLSEGRLLVKPREEFKKLV